MDTRSEEYRQALADIQEAIEAAESKGYRLTLDVNWDSWESSQIASVDVDLLSPANTFIGTIRSILY